MATSFDLAFENHDGFLLVYASGEWTQDNANDAIQQIADAARERGFSRVLVDARELPPPKSDFQRFLAGQEIAAKWRGLKAAILYPAEHTNKFAENTAVNRGAVMAVFADPDEATQWLLGAPASSSSSSPTGS